MLKANFLRWFNRSFWKAFSSGTLLIWIPKSEAEKKGLLEEVYGNIVSARYAPGIPEIELVMNKGQHRVVIVVSAPRCKCGAWLRPQCSSRFGQLQDINVEKLRGVG
jgi:hypothetical protein